MTTLIDEQIGPCVDCKKRPSPDTGRVCCCNFYELPDDAARAAVKKLLEQVVAGTATLRNQSGDEIELHVAAKVVTDADARTALGEFVAGRRW